MGGSACKVPHRNTAVAFIHSSFEILAISCESSCHESNNGKAPSRGTCAWLHNRSNPSAPMTSGLSSSANWENSAAARCSEYTSDFYRAKISDAAMQPGKDQTAASEDVFFALLFWATASAKLSPVAQHKRERKCIWRRDDRKNKIASRNNNGYGLPARR